MRFYTLQQGTFDLSKSVRCISGKKRGRNTYGETASELCPSPGPSDVVNRSFNDAIAFLQESHEAWFYCVHPRFQSLVDLSQRIIEQYKTAKQTDEVAYSFVSLFYCNYHYNIGNYNRALEGLHVICHGPRTTQAWFFAAVLYGCTLADASLYSCDAQAGHRAPWRLAAFSRLLFVRGR